MLEYHPGTIKMQKFGTIDTWVEITTLQIYTQIDTTCPGVTARVSLEFKKEVQIGPGKNVFMAE